MNCFKSMNLTKRFKMLGLLLAISSSVFSQDIMGSPDHYLPNGSIAKFERQILFPRNMNAAIFSGGEFIEFVGRSDDRPKSVAIGQEYCAVLVAEADRPTRIARGRQFFLYYGPNGDEVRLFLPNPKHHMDFPVSIVCRIARASEGVWTDFGRLAPKESTLRRHLGNSVSLDPNDSVIEIIGDPRHSGNR